jgi:glycosyltransferase involved in cell wall biosynthesis
MGNDVISIIRKDAAIEPILNEMNLPVISVAYSRLSQYLFNKSTVNKIQNIMKPLNADLIIVHKQSDFQIVREAVGNTIKIIGVIHSFNAKYINYADSLIAVSEPVKQYLIEKKYKGDIFVIPNMVNINSKPTYRNMPEKPLIGTMGVFRRNKNFHILIQALNILKQKGEPFQAIIAGEGRAKLELLYLRWKYGLANELTIKAWVPNNERDKFLDDLDIFVLCSTKETFGMVVIEAMARMKRVIATICGGPEHIITHGKDGYLIKSGSAELIANQIIDVIHYNPEVDKIPDNALNTVMNNYSTEAVSKSLHSLARSTQNL